jgi:hypothetical protein
VPRPARPCPRRLPGRAPDRGPARPAVTAVPDDAAPPAIRSSTGQPGVTRRTRVHAASGDPEQVQAEDRSNESCRQARRAGEGVGEEGTADEADDQPEDRGPGVPCRRGDHGAEYDASATPARAGFTVPAHGLAVSSSGWVGVGRIPKTLIGQYRSHARPMIWRPDRSEGARVSELARWSPSGTAPRPDHPAVLRRDRRLRWVFRRVGDR